jgi:hypothetical protein
MAINDFYELGSYKSRGITCLKAVRMWGFTEGITSQGRRAPDANSTILS